MHSYPIKFRNIIVLVSILAFSLPGFVWANDEEKVKLFIEEQCTSCHRITGEAKSRFELIAPDLMWAGSKFKRPWLVDRLTGNEDIIYQKNYRWDQSLNPEKHPTISKKDAEKVADYIKKHLIDSRVKKDSIDLSHFTELQASFGRELFIEHSCTGCHQIMQDGEKSGGPQSTSMFNSGKRLTKDWILRFNMMPPDFVPHSGEFVADVSELGLHYVTGFLATEGDEAFKFYEPWKSEFFKNANSKRGKTIYREYCMQCHGATGGGDGPAASGLEPKPAVHSKMALDQFPMDYLYNVVYYGGKAVGKSPYMPYWGLTLGDQGVADVITYMRETFKGGEEMAAAPGKKGRGDCPQKRNTKAVSFKYKNKKNPLKPTPANLKAGEELFQKKAKPMACQLCHGKHGDGKGPGGAGINPSPRNFTCGETMKDISDGQLFGITREGSPGTAMPAFKNLKDKEVWQLILYIRQFSN
ncbi:MAG: cytochrome c [Candidatus Nitronauta litoralis]|uniref:Cytochrome c n=1 Tax=Candidatus Nitronauta litoralis TaxID=2705533 RepID=A0A7T0BWP5_9BACT|nr:MAG: cytochrome c [Candidatus Nitronauta litoralis]